MSRKSEGKVCCVPGCPNAQLKNVMTFYTFPNRDYEVQRKKLWIARVRREGDENGPWVPTKHTRICAEHFVGGVKSNNPTEENFNPTIFPWKPAKESCEARRQRLALRNEKKSVNSARNSEDVPSNRMRLKAHAVPNHNLPLTDPSFDKKAQINEDRLKRRLHREGNAVSRVSGKNSILEVSDRYSENESSIVNITSVLSEPSSSNEERTEVAVQVNSRDFGPKFIDLIKNDSELSTVTGIESFALLRAIIDCAKLVKEVNHLQKLTLEDKIILTLMKLKQNLTYDYLADHFQISPRHCQIIFEDTILMLSACLKHVIVWQSSEEFSNVRVILDCTEVFIQRPQNLCCRFSTYSQHKSNDTCKIMTGVTPAGCISFVSKIYGGRASDEAIFKQSEIMQLLEPGDAVMVDRGFLIDEICQLYNVKCIRPQKQSQKIERLNQRIKDFKIVGETMPADLVPLLEHIFIVIYGIVNLSTSILKDDKFMAQ